MQRAGASGLGSCPHRPMATTPRSGHFPSERTRPRPPRCLAWNAHPLSDSPTPLHQLLGLLSLPPLQRLCTFSAIPVVTAFTCLVPSPSSGGVLTSMSSPQRRSPNLPTLTGLPPPVHCISPAALRSYPDLMLSSARSFTCLLSTCPVRA